MLQFSLSIGMGLRFKTRLSAVLQSGTESVPELGQVWHGVDQSETNLTLDWFETVANQRQI